MGVALSGINPKNLLLTVAAAAAVAQAGVSTGDEIVAMAVFIAVGTLGPGIPVAIYFGMGKRAAHCSTTSRPGWARTTRRSWLWCCSSSARS